MAASSDELVLLERVFLRIGSAETDEQLQNALAKFLPPVLLKLASPQEGVRKKVMELLVHINKRVKSRPAVELPMETLLQQYQDPESTSFVINFTIIYLKIGFTRLSVDQQVELVPNILNSLESKPQTHQDSLLMLLIPLLGKVKIPTDPEKRKSLFGLNEKPQISKHLLSLLLDMLLLPYGALSPQKAESESGNTEGGSTTDVWLPVPPGMSEYTFKRVTGENNLNAEKLEQIKLGIVQFLSNDIFSNEDILIHLVVAAADTRFSVANLADIELKKIVGALNWSSQSVSMPLYLLFLGSQNQNINANMKKLPASTRIRLKLLTYLGRVMGDGFVLIPAIQVIFDSLYGTNTNSRLKTLALNFTSSLVQYADEKQLGKVATVIKSGMIKLINEGELQHEGQAFIIIGLLSRRFPMIIYHDSTILEMFFNKLKEADTDLKLQIREGALNLVSAYKYDLSKEDVDKDGRLGIMFALMKTHIKSEEPMARFIVVRSLPTIFPPNHVPSKFLLLMATGDSKDEVSNEALKALYGTTRKADVDMSSKNKSSDAPKVVMPEFKEIVKYVYNEAQDRLRENVQKVTVGNHVLPFAINVYVEVLIYIRLCLTKSLNVPLTRNVLRHPSEETPLIRDYLQKCFNEDDSAEPNGLLKYVSLVRDLLIASPGVEPLCCMVEAIGCVPKLHTSVAADLPWLRDQLNSTKEEIREHTSLLYAIVMCEALSDKDFTEAIKYLIKQTENKSLEAQNGAILGIGNCFERKIMMTKSNNKSFAHNDVLKQALDVLIPLLSHANPLLVSPACTAIGLIARSGSLPLENGCDKSGSPDAKRPTKENNTKYSLVTKLLDVMNTKELSTKYRERAAKALGFLCVGEDFPFTREVIQGLLNTVKETKDVEVHFTIGESLVMCVQGIWSPEARDAWTTLDKDYHPENVMQDEMSNDNLEWLVVELLKYAQTLHPNSRQAACIWLLALLKSCVDRDPIKNRLKVLQNTFMDLLGENNDIIQDAASKGLCLIYDYSKSEELLAALVEQLTVGRRQAVQVEDDTKLFEEGQLGKTPTGGNLSTYKELCSLASELNKPDLIYQFMHLANHNAIWNSKKGAAFGFSSIAEKCGEHLQQHLANIIPKLYRYQYDPSPNLQNSMQNIWHVLVTEPQKALDTYHNEILSELLSNLTSAQYRVRQSCCLALQDFLKGSGNRSIHDSVHVMDELWNQLFRVMDDHHEQTRIAATKTTKVLSKLCIRGCDLNQGKAGVKMMEAILPVLLNKGINNAVSEVRLISLQTISELVGSAGKQLKPFLPQLIPALLLATGELESTKLSYLSTMYGGQSQVQDVLDNARASMAKSHFTTETVSKCLQYADASILEELVPKVTELMKSNIGLGTRVVCAHFITLLTVHLGKDLQPYTGKFLAALVNGLTDRNSSIRKHYASAIGHLVSSAKESSLEKLFAKIQHWYFEREDDSIRSACALTIQSIGNHNQDVLKNHSDVVLPLVFFAMHAEKTPDTQNTLEIWNEIWAEQSPGTETGIRQNIEAICDILKTALESPSWTMKAQAANSVSTVASKLGVTMESKHRNNLIQILLSGLSGRTWSGKDKLLKALASICSNCKESLKQDTDIDINSIIEVVLKESRKDEIVYKIAALQSLGEILASLDVDRFEDVYNIVENILSKEVTATSKEDDEENVSNEEVSSKRENRLKLREIVYELLGNAWPKDAKATQAKFNNMYVEHCVTYLPTTTRNVQVAIVASLRCYIEKLVLLTEKDLDEESDECLAKIIEDILKALSYSLGIAKHTRLRKEALNVFFSLAKKLKENGNSKYYQNVVSTFNNCLPEISKDNQPEIKSRVIDLKNLLSN